MADKKAKDSKGKKTVIRVSNPNGSYDIVVRPKPLPKPPEPPQVTGRPRIYSEELALEVLAAIAEGDSLRKIAGRDDMPAISTIYKWIEEVEGFSERYARAKQDQAESSADHISYIAEKTLDGFYDPSAARVAIDAHKWNASKLLAKKYGDKIDITSDGEKLGVTLSAEQSEQLIRARAKRADLQGDSE